MFELKNVETFDVFCDPGVKLVFEEDRVRRNENFCSLPNLIKLFTSVTLTVESIKLDRLWNVSKSSILFRPFGLRPGAYP